MPEAAEVELVRRSLIPLVGRRLTQIRVVDEALTGVGDTLVGRDLTDVRRIGKRLGLEFGGIALIVHLRMTGRLDLVAGGDPKLTRAQLDFGGHTLVFSDLRRLGSWAVAPSVELGRGLGIDLLDAPADEFRLAAQRCAKRSRAAKSLMLDQAGPIAGAGNYLTDEALFLSGVFPGAHASSVSSEQWTTVWETCRALACRALAGRAYPLAEYVAPAGTRGLQPEQLVCYGRRGMDCVVCESELGYMMIASRGTTYCPECQPA